jgi:2-dehydro-3-deoxygluconokinase
LNYRPKLWTVAGSDSRGVDTISQIVEHVDVLVGNEEDLQRGLGIPGPETRVASPLDPANFIAMIERVLARFPRIRAVATTLREVQSATHHRWSAVAWIDGQTHVAPTIDLDVLDRVGGGDGFASGFFYGLLSGESPEEALKLGWAHGALLTTFPGDTTMATLEQVRAVAGGASARIQR